MLQFDTELVNVLAPSSLDLVFHDLRNNPDCSSEEKGLQGHAASGDGLV